MIHSVDRLSEAISYYFKIDIMRIFAILAFIQGCTLLMTEGKEAFIKEELLLSPDGAKFIISKYSSWGLKYINNTMSEKKAIDNFKIELRNNKISWINKFSRDIFMTEDDIDIITYFIDMFKNLSTEEINGALLSILKVDTTDLKTMVMPQEELYEGFLNFTKERGTEDGFIERCLRGSNSL